MDQPRAASGAQAAAATATRSTSWRARCNERGFTLIPLSLYFKDGRAKVEIAVARGKKTYDKRHALAARQADREKQQALGRQLKGMD